MMSHLTCELAAKNADRAQIESAMNRFYAKGGCVIQIPSLVRPERNKPKAYLTAAERKRASNPKPIKATFSDLLQSMEHRDEQAQAEQPASATGA